MEHVALPGGVAAGGGAEAAASAGGPGDASGGAAAACGVAGERAGPLCARHGPAPHPAAEGARAQRAAAAAAVPR